jgi:hypothetical protein
VTRATFVAVVALALTCGAQTPTFDEGYEQGKRANPPGVSVHLATEDGRTTVSEDKFLHLQITFSASRQGVYAVQLADFGHGDELIWRKAGTVEPHRITSDHGIVCCTNARKALKATPVTVRLPTYFHVRLTAGDYDFFVRTQRVYGPKPVKYYSDNPIVTSDILHIKVQPASKP